MSRGSTNPWKVAFTLFMATTLCANASAQSHPFSSFDVPVAVGHTTPVKINSTGQIAGYFLTNAYHGFLRNPMDKSYSSMHRAQEILIQRRLIAADRSWALPKSQLSLNMDVFVLPMVIFLKSCIRAQSGPLPVRSMTAD
jgi:hypothetical protein